MKKEQYIPQEKMNTSGETSMRAYQLVNCIEAIKAGEIKLDFVKVDGDSIEIVVKEKDFWRNFEKFELEIALESVGFKKITIIEK